MPGVLRSGERLASWNGVTCLCAMSLSCKVVGASEEHFLRSEDMSAVVKDADHVAEFVEAIFAEVATPMALHPSPSICTRHVAAVCMDSPNVNKAAMKKLQEKYPQIAFVPCAFHGLDGLFGKMVKELSVLSRASRAARRVTRFVSNKSRVRAAVRKLAVKHAVRKTRLAGRKIHAVFYTKVRKTREYPQYLQVKRAYQLNFPAYKYFQGEGKEICRRMKRWEEVEAATVTHRNAFVAVAKYFLAVMRPIIHKLRVVDSTKVNCMPQLIVHLCDLRQTLHDKFVELGYSYRLIRARDGVDLEQAPGSCLSFIRLEPCSGPGWALCGQREVSHRMGSLIGVQNVTFRCSKHAIKCSCPGGDRKGPEESPQSVQ